MNITLINPPQVFSRTQVAAGVIPPLGLAYLAAYAREKGHTITIIDALGEAPRTIIKRNRYVSLRGLSFNSIIGKIPPETNLIGISNLFTVAFPSILDLCLRIKQERDIPIVLGGANASAMAEEFLGYDQIDYVIISEGEETLVKLCNALTKKRGISKIDGLGYKRLGKIVINHKKVFIKNLDSIPFPARDLLPMRKYHKNKEAHGPSKKRWTPILSSRGCPFHCSFCTSGLWANTWRARSPKNVVDEMEQCKDYFGITEFHFEDENMTLDKKRMIDFCNELEDRRLDVSWQTPNGIRASTIDYHLLRHMKSAGCTNIVLAPESGSIRVLKIMEKANQKDKIVKIIRWAQRLKIKTAAFFILGTPGEKKEDILKTISYAVRLAREGLDDVIFGLYIPLPGSPLYTNMKIKIKDYEDLAIIGDLKRSISWSEYLKPKELLVYRLGGYAIFHASRFFFHPLRFLKTIINVLKGVEETKTERVLHTFLKRIVQ